MKEKKFEISKPYMIIGYGDNMKLLDFSLKEGHWRHLATGKITIYDSGNDTEQIRVQDNEKIRIYSYNPNRPEEFIHKIIECKVIRDFKCGTIALDNSFGQLFEKEKLMAGYLIENDAALSFGYEIAPGMYFLYQNDKDDEDDYEIIKNQLFTLGRGNVILKRISKDEDFFTIQKYYDYIETDDFHLFRKNDTIYDIFDKDGITLSETSFKKNKSGITHVQTNIYGIPVIFELTNNRSYRLSKFNNVENIKSIFTIKENYFNYMITFEGDITEKFLFVSNKNLLKKI